MDDYRWNAGLKLWCTTHSRLRFSTILDAVESAWGRNPELTLGQVVNRLADGEPEKIDDVTLYKRAYQERDNITCALVSSDTA